MNIRMVGTGNAFAKKNDNNNAVIETGDFRLLVDCGITLPKALHQMGLNFSELDAVLISHIHGDHVGGLEELAFQMMFKYKRKPVLYIADPLIAPLWENTLRGGLTQDPLNKLEHFFDVRPINPNEEIELHPGLKVKLIQTEHIPRKNSYSLLFNNTFFYSADMRFDGELLKRLVENGVSTIFHDCQLEGPGEVHATLEELLTLPEHIQKITWLMHYADNVDAFKGHSGQMRFVEPHTPYEF